MLGKKIIYFITSLFRINCRQMRTQPNIFIGSSSEAKAQAETIASSLKRVGALPRPWWDTLPRNKTLLEGLEETLKICNAAIILVGEDDWRAMRGDSAMVPRDNTLFEYGLFSGRYGRESVLLVTLGDPALPGDLNGLLCHSIEEITAETLRDWVNSLNYGMNDDLSQAVYDDISLSGVQAIHAVDVIGPSAWASPQTYRYVAQQFRKYVDIKGNPGESTRLLSHRIYKSTEAAINKAKAAGLRESRSFLADVASVRQETSNFEVSRILLWSEEELVTSIGEGVVDFHETFDVPLFFLSREILHKDRKFDYLFVSGAIEREPVVYYGSRENGFATYKGKGVIKGLGNVKEKYEGLLQDKQLLVARDALDLLLSE